MSDLLLRMFQERWVTWPKALLALVLVPVTLVLSIPGLFFVGRTVSSLFGFNAWQDEAISLESVQMEIPAARGDVCDCCLVKHVARTRFASHIDLVANLVPQHVLVASHVVGFSLVIDKLIIALRTDQASSEIIGLRGSGMAR